MRFLKVSMLLQVVVLVTACVVKQERFLSTNEALERYSILLDSQSFFVFPEMREEPIKWFDSIPEGKIKDTESVKSFLMIAQPDEFYVYQLGVWALRKDIQNIQIEFSDLKNENGQTITSNRMTCFNKGGIDLRGNPFSKKINVPAGRIQALYMGIDLDGIEKGKYTGTVSVVAGEEKHMIPFRLKVAGKPVLNQGYNEGKRLARLNWLNSTIGIDDKITKGYIPVKVEKNKVSILGRTLNIAKNGLPASISSYFSASNQSINAKGEPVVNKPFRFIIEKENGELVRLVPGKLTFTKQMPSKVVWNVLNTSEEFVLECIGQMDFDGFIDYRLKLTAKSLVKVKDIRLEIPIVNEKSEYMMGLGHEGGFRTPDWKWKWDVSKNQDMLWVGAVNGGLHIKWKDENYVRPLASIYYEFNPLKMPSSWGNKGKGGINVSQQKNEVKINAYSGIREMKSGDKLNYDFELLITPFRLIDKQIKFGDRYYHGEERNTSVKIGKAKENGANIINIHHNNDIYPFINYPYLDPNVEELTQLVSNTHDENLRMKFYYTTREITKNLPELWAFKSLNGEVIFPGPGNECKTIIHKEGPDEWLKKNLREKYIPAWHTFVTEGKFKGVTDLSVITTPDSRLNNFYIAGLDWMCRNIGIDGVYIDDTALDRFTLRRARKIIDKYCHEGRIDFHSWNQFNEWASFANCLNVYMDLLPYLDLVWIGEGRDYDRMPDHWLIEVSGIPFGLSGQTLEGMESKAHWRGMVYGITNRAGYSKKSPKYIWKFFDEYRFSEREMIGYWDKKCPVRTDNPNLVASVFKGSEDIVIAIGNWSDEKQIGSLQLDWKSLNINPKKCSVLVPCINGFQESLQLTIDQLLEIEGGKGMVVVVQGNK